MHRVLRAFNNGANGAGKLVRKRGGIKKCMTVRSRMKVLNRARTIETKSIYIYI
jgi:hypothetical protein